MEKMHDFVSLVSFVYFVFLPSARGSVTSSALRNFGSSTLPWLHASSTGYSPR